VDQHKPFPCHTYIHLKDCDPSHSSKCSAYWSDRSLCTLWHPKPA